MSPYVPSDESRTTAGVHLLQVAKCEEARSKSSGDNMLAVEYRVMDGFGKGERLRDWIMLEGGGAFQGGQKLRALGFAKGQGFEASELIGRSVWASIKLEESVYKEEMQVRAVINSKTKDSLAGMWHVDNPPESIDAQPLANSIDDHTPVNPDETPF